MAKNKTILCLVDRYYPESSANTVCCDCIMKYFKEKGHTVDFLSIKDNIDGEKYSIYNGSNVIKIDNYYHLFLKKYRRVFRVKEWDNIPWVFRKFIGVVRKLRKLFKLSTQNTALDNLNYKDIYNDITKINKHYDIIISFCMPFALNVIAGKLMELGLANEWYSIFLDPFVNNKCLEHNKITYRQKIAPKVLKNVKKIFMQEGIIQENIKMGYNPEYHNKVIEIALPNLKDRKIQSKVDKSNTDILMTYAGHLYEDIRRPNQMLDIISQFPKNYTLQIIGDGCEDIIEKKKSLFKNSKLIMKGKIPFEKCLEEESRSNILVNIGNVITNQMPSKVFEYISTGKPVVNFYFSEDDLGLKYFKNYPLCFNLNVNNYTQNDVNNLIDFCNKNAYEKWSFEDATKNLHEYRSENICKKIYEEIMIRDEIKKS